MSQNDGGPAFPVECDYTTEGMSGRQTSNNTAWHTGITMRDYFAAKALTGILLDVTNPNEDQCAAMAYRLADAMMKARESANG